MLPLGANRYPSNAAALAMPRGAKEADARMKRALDRAALAPDAFNLLGRIHLAGLRRDTALLELLAEEAGGLVADSGGAA